MREQVCEWLLEWLSKRGKINGNSRAACLDINYFDAGLLTSVDVIEFVVEIEAKFAIQFSEADLQDQRFVTISGLSDLILERSMQADDCPKL